MALARPALPALFALTLLAGCVSSPAPQAPPVSEQAPAEIKLNLPDAKTCDCTPEATQDYTFLEKGFSALSRGEYDDALEYFQRYRRLERSDAAKWEADIAIAFT